jgi:sugar phosphate isomerase/epimerase
MWKLACADFTFPLLPHDQVLRLIAMLDLQGVDIGLLEKRSHLWPSHEFADLPHSARRLKQKLADQGLQLADVFLQMDPDFRPYAINQPEAARRARAREWFLRTLEYTAEAGGQHLLTLPGVHFEEESQADSLGRAVDELAWRVEQAEQHGLIFAIEAHVGSIVPDPTSAAELIGRVPGLTLTLDYTHFTRVGFADAEIEPLIAYASHFHIRGARPGRLQARFAQNTIDYRRVVEVAKAHNYQGWLGLEYVWQDWEGCNECDNLSETILFRDFLRSL